MEKKKALIIYTSEDCAYCSLAEKIAKEVVDNYQGLVKYHKVKLNSKNMPVNNDVKSFPTIIIGDKKIEGVPEKDQLHTAILS